MARPDDKASLPHDQAFKAIFSHPRMIADALRGYAVQPNGPLDPRIVAALDFSTLEKLPAEWITPAFRRRIGDQAWRVRFRWARDWSDAAGCLLILVEFQFGPAPDMALRMASYALQLYAELETAGQVRAGRPRPPILPLLIHNGRHHWTEELLAQGRAEGVVQGREQGMEQGRAEGVAAQRASLRRQATLRFGASARRLDPFLDRVSSSARLSEISAWLMLDTIDQLAAKVEAAAAEDHAH